MTECYSILYLKKNVQMQFRPCRPWLTSAIPVAKVRESPDVSKADTVADAGEQKLIFAAPLPSGKVDRWLTGRRGRAGGKLGLWNRTAHTMRHREPIHLGLTLSRRENRNQSDFCIEVYEHFPPSVWKRFFFWLSTTIYWCYCYFIIYLESRNRWTVFVNEFCPVIITGSMVSFFTPEGWKCWPEAHVVQCQITLCCEVWTL